MTRKTSQLEHVEHLLRANGKRGVHTHELRAIMIANPSERICKLERRGWIIEHSREKPHGNAFGSRYVLVSEPEFPGVEDEAGGVSEAAPVNTSPVLNAEQPSLFSLDAGARKTGHYEDAAA